MLENIYIPILEKDWKTFYFPILEKDWKTFYWPKSGNLLSGLDIMQIFIN